jgi:hypothetical protein
MVILVAPTEPDGQWRQSNWRPLKGSWPKRKFQLVSFQQNEWTLYNSVKGNLIHSREDHEQDITHFSFSEPEDIYLEYGEKSQKSLVNVEQRLFLNLNHESQKIQSQVSLEFKGQLIDLVALELLDQQKSSLRQTQIYFSQSTRLSKVGEPWKVWPEEDGHFKLRFQLSYQGELTLDRGELNYQIWWKVPTPSWDMRADAVVPDQQGTIRRPLEPGDQVEFDKEMVWPYELLDGRWVSQSSKVRAPYWSIMVVYSNSGELRARSAIPWVSRPLRCYSHLSYREKIEQLQFFDALNSTWRHLGGREHAALHFEGFFEDKNSEKPRAFAITKENFWEKLQPWRNEKSKHFDELWIASWNQADDDLMWPNWHGKTNLFKSWNIQIKLSDGEPLKSGVWSLENEAGEQVLSRKVNQGLVQVLPSAQNDDLERLWSSQKLYEKIKDDRRQRVYQVRRDQGTSGSEKMGWLWVDRGAKVLENRILPWGRLETKWKPLQELFFHQGNWHFSLSDHESPDLSLIWETSQGRFEKQYPFEWGNIQMPLALEHGQTIHSIWLKRVKDETSLWSEAIHLFPVDKILSIKENYDHTFTWLIESGESTYLLNWNELNCEVALNLKSLKDYGIVRLCKELLGAWLIQLEKPYRGHRLLTWAPHFHGQEVLGGDLSTIKTIGDFCIVGDLEQHLVVAGDLEEHALKMYSSEWKLIDIWQKPGFSPRAILSDPLNTRMFWVLDRRKTGQSFLYLFTWEGKKIQFKKVVLVPLPLGEFGMSPYVGMTIHLNEKSQRVFAFSDPNKKRILEYDLEEESFNFKGISEYSQSILQQGGKPLLFPRDLVYMGPANAKQLFVLDAHNSFVRVK